MVARPRKALLAYNGYDAGLGNRVRVTMACANYAEFLGRDFYYVWPVGPKFGPRFDELWDWDRGRVVPRAASRLAAKVPAFAYTDETLAGLERRPDSLLWQVRTGSPVQVPDGVRDWREDFRELTPVPEIAEKVTSIFDTHFRGRPFIGVFIRAHSVSHHKTLATSPVSWFEERLAELRRQHPGIPFYVSADVQEVQDAIVEMFPGSYGQPDKGPYNSTRAVREAIVDLYLLASAHHVVGPHHSSFTHLAGYLNNGLTITESPLSDTPAEPDIVSPGVVADPLRPWARASSDARVDVAAR